MSHSQDTASHQPGGAIVLLGASGHAKVVADAVRREGRWQLAGFLDQNARPGQRHFGAPVLGTEADLPRLAAELSLAGIFVAIGDNHTRSQAVQRIRSSCPQLLFVSIVHPAATVAEGVLISEGSILMAGATVNADARIGAHCILNTNSSFDHDSTLADFASLAPGVTTGGNVQIGTCTAISLGASVIHGVKIGEHVVVGAGATVLADLPDHVVAYGTPAKVIRSRETADRYL
jgi:sugar O-acyltransferase (sialic acid O-acetyltransferase NeuD family)